LREKIRIPGINTQDGAALLIAVLILLILTVLGVYAVTTSTLETKITGFHKWHVEAFYAADAGIDYAMAQCPFGTMDSLNPPSTWSDSITEPHVDDVTATYRGETLPPVGSRTGHRTGVTAHHFHIRSVGKDQADIASAVVDIWGYRLGF